MTIPDFQNLHVGNMIRAQVGAGKISALRICNFLHCTEHELEKMYSEANMSTELLLKWSKLLEYDFFRIFSQHILFYYPEVANAAVKFNKEESLPVFRKKLYTEDAINYIIHLVNTGQKSKRQIMEEYHVPKTTLYKWLSNK